MNAPEERALVQALGRESQEEIRRLYALATGLDDLDLEHARFSEESRWQLRRLDQDKLPALVRLANAATEAAARIRGR